MIEQALFHDSIHEALRDVVMACGGYKAVGRRLWPEKSVEAAGRLLADCLNDARSERLAPEQVLLLLRMGREAGCHAAMAYLAGEAGYQAIPVEPEDEKAKLQREFIDAVGRMERLLAKADRISPGVEAKLRAA